MKKFMSLIFILICYSGVSFSQQGFDVIVAKTYRLKYKKVEKILPLVRRIMSNKGVVESSNEFNIFVLKDYPPNLALVDSLVAKFDVPLKQINVSIRLLLGYNPGPASLESEIPSVSDSTEVARLLGGFYDFGKITEVDMGFIRTEEKSTTTMNLGSGKYSITFEIDYIDNSSKIVKFRSFRLSEVVSDVQGKYLKPLINTSAEMKDGTTELITVFKKENSDKSLIVIVSVQSV